MPPKKSDPFKGMGPIDVAVCGVVLVFVLLISLFPIRNNDVWWHLAVGKRIIETGQFIRQDPFMFSVPGTPWVPHAWLAGVILYLVKAGLSFGGLVVLRAALVLSIVAAMLAVVRRLGLALVLASPLALLAILNIHSRFILRPHLFEYLFLVLLLGHLVGSSNRGIRGVSVPVVLQVLWVNLHASFYLGPLVVLMFSLGEWLSAKLARPLGTRTIRNGEVISWPATGLVLGLMGVASFVNPSPAAFVFQPLANEQREFLTRYTLEWRSPFDPFLSAGAFHPYYEILLVATAVVFVVSITRLKLASLALVGTFAVLSTQAHRFRVEFALLAVPLLLDQLRASAPFEAWRRRPVMRRSPVLWGVVGGSLLVSSLLVYSARDRIEIALDVSDRFPKQAFDFVRREGIAWRSYHTIGFGSYLIGEVYPDRQSFIDGRNVDAGLHRDFLACQSTSTAFNGVVRQYDLDGFILPAPERSDGGIERLHHFLIQAKNWAPVYVDRVAFVYVRRSKVPAEWLSQNEFVFYHPLTFGQQQFRQEDLEKVAGELARASAMDSSYVRPFLDSARFYGALGDRARAGEAIDRALAIEPDNAEARELIRRLE